MSDFVDWKYLLREIDLNSISCLERTLEKESMRVKAGSVYLGSLRVTGPLPCNDVGEPRSWAVARDVAACR